MKLAAVSIIRDESDIVESWVRHNLHFVDRLYVVDDGSTDQTPRILSLLEDEQLPISITLGKSTAGFHQGQKTTALVEHAMADRPWDFIFLLDGDEFIVAKDRKALEDDLATLGTYKVGGLNPRHYVMIDQANSSEIDPLKRLQHVAVHDPFVFKVVVPGHVATEPGFAIVDGNHRITKWGETLPSHLLPNVELVHFPARSEAQLVSKGLSGYLRWSARLDFTNGAPVRLLEAAGSLKEEENIQITALTNLATILGGGRGAQTRFQPFTELRALVRYPEYAHIYPYRRVISAMDDLIYAFKTLTDENIILKKRTETFYSRMRRTCSKRHRQIQEWARSLRPARDQPPTTHES